MKKILIILGILIFINIVIITVSKAFANEISLDVDNYNIVQAQIK
jgi:hypothetical protein